MRHLSEDQQRRILNDDLPTDLDYQYYINKYCPELKNMKNIINNVNIKCLKPINKDFINGLIDGDGSFTFSIRGSKILIKSG